MTEQIRSWPDALFYYESASTANVREQVIKLQQTGRRLRALNDASTVDTNGDILQDVLTGLSLGNLTQRHKWRVLYDTTNDRFLVQRNTGTDASKVWAERFRIDASGNITITGTTSISGALTATGGITLGGNLDANGYYFRNLEKIHGRTRTDRLLVHGNADFDGVTTFDNDVTFTGRTFFYTESIDNLALGWKHIQTKTASSSATIDFLLPSAYPRFMVTLEAVRPATDATSLTMRVSTDAGSSFDSAGNYGTAGVAFSNIPSTEAVATTAATEWNLIGDGGVTQDNGALAVLSGTVYINYLGTAALQSRGRSQCEFVDSSGLFTIMCDIGLFRAPDAAINALRFLYSSGNIASGTFRLYGLKTSP